MTGQITQTLVGIVAFIWGTHFGSKMAEALRRGLSLTTATFLLLAWVGCWVVLGSVARRIAETIF